MLVVFYDGNCGLCQRSIQFLLKADKEKRLLFAPLNGETYKLLNKDGPSTLSSVIYYQDGKSFEKSTAILKLCLALGGFYRLYSFFIIIPPFLRDFIYDQIAKRRKKFSCIILNRNNQFFD